MPSMSSIVATAAPPFSRADGDYRAFLELLAAAKAKHPVKILAFCLMPNHFHLVLSAIHDASLSPFMHWWMTSHVRRYHRYYRSHGHVWQGRFKVSRFNKTAICSLSSAMSCTIQSEPGWWSGRRVALVQSTVSPTHRSALGITFS
ncbi:MAG: transposase [Nitrospira sp.]